MNELTEQPKTSLWHLQQQLVELVEFREQCETEEERQAADNAIAEYVKLEISKVDNIRAYMRHCEVMAAAAKEEKQRQADRQKAWEGRLETLEKIVYNAMQLSGKTKIEGKTGHFQIKKNGGKTPVIVEDDLVIPSSLCDYIKKPRVDDIRKLLEGGKEVPGAKLGERGAHLEVK